MYAKIYFGTKDVFASHFIMSNVTNSFDAKIDFGNAESKNLVVISTQKYSCIFIK